jgi:hypothetical protein
VVEKVVDLAVWESDRFAARYEAGNIDWFILTCYRLIRSFEQTARDEHGIKPASRESPAWTLRDIADRAFTIGWNRTDLNSLQRAQILDIIWSVANLAARTS